MTYVMLFMMLTACFTPTKWFKDLNKQQTSTTGCSSEGLEHLNCCFILPTTCNHKRKDSVGQLFKSVSTLQHVTSSVSVYR